MYAHMHACTCMTLWSFDKTEVSVREVLPSRRGLSCGAIQEPADCSGLEKREQSGPSHHSDYKGKSPLQLLTLKGGLVRRDTYRKCLMKWPGPMPLSPLTGWSLGRGCLFSSCPAQREHTQCNSKKVRSVLRFMLIQLKLVHRKDAQNSQRRVVQLVSILPLSTDYPITTGCQGRPGHHSASFPFCFLLTSPSSSAPSCALPHFYDFTSRLSSPTAFWTEILCNLGCLSPALLFLVLIDLLAELGQEMRAACLSAHSRLRTDKSFLCFPFSLA